MEAFMSMLVSVVAALAAGVLAVDARKASLQAGDHQLIRVHSFTGEPGFNAGFGQHDQRPLANRGNHHHIDLLGSQPPWQCSRLMLGCGQALAGGYLAPLRGSLDNGKFLCSPKMLAKLPIRHGDGYFEEGFLAGGDCACVHTF